MLKMGVRFFCLAAVLFFSYTSLASSFLNKKKQGASGDKEQIVKIEKDWLQNLHKRSLLDEILAPDFIHVVSQGAFLTKAQHINWAVKHAEPKGYKQKFDTLFVRIYGIIAIASGIVETFNQNDVSIRKSAFTDVFLKQNGRWQVINAQENLIPLKWQIKVR